MTDIIILSDYLDTVDHFLFEGVDVSKGPHFRKKEVAEFFFGRTVHWMRKLEREGFMFWEGRQIGNTRFADNNHRDYDLAEVETIAYSLFTQNKIKLRQLRLALAILRIEGQIWGILAGDINVPNL